MNKPLKIYDVRAKKSFTTSDYQIVVKGRSKMAKAISPQGNESWRIIGRA